MIALLIIVSFFSYPSLDFMDLTILRILKRAASVLMFAGFLAGWKWDIVAGIMILCGYMVVAAINGILYLNWMQALFPVVGICYLVSGLYQKVKNR